MKRTNKKGFTIVELVIVIAVIAILAAVLIPTFVSLTRKANISNDTVVAKNLNTAAIAEGAKDFDSALAAVKDAGYLVANLNAKATDCYFVWEEDTDQFLLYDMKEKKIIYSNTEVKGDPDDSWCFAVNNPTDKAEVLAAWGSVQTKMVVVDSADLSSILASGGTIYMDESIILNNSSLLTFDTANVTSTVELGNSMLNTSGILHEEGSGIIPIEVKQGAVTFNGGVVSTAGENTNYHGLKVAYALQTSTGTTSTFNDTKFDLSTYEAQIRIFGTTTMDGVVIDAVKSGVETRYNGQLTLKDVTITAKGDSSVANHYGTCLWACNFNSKGEDEKAKDHNGTAKIIVESGTYTTEACHNNYASVYACGGTVEIKGGTFTAPEKLMFGVVAGGAIIIKGGTFNDTPFANVDWSKLHRSECATVALEDGGILIFNNSGWAENSLTAGEYTITRTSVEGGYTYTAVKTAANAG